MYRNTAHSTSQVYTITFPCYLSTCKRMGGYVLASEAAASRTEGEDKEAYMKGGCNAGRRS